MFEKIIGIWNSMTDLDLIPVITRDAAVRPLLNNNELYKHQHDMRKQYKTHVSLRNRLSSSQVRIWSWIDSIYSRLREENTPLIRADMNKCDG